MQTTTMALRIQLQRSGYRVIRGVRTAEGPGLVVARGDKAWEVTGPAEAPVWRLLEAPPESLARLRAALSVVSGAA